MASYTGGMREAARIQALEEERAARKKETERQKGNIVSATASAGVLGPRKFSSRAETVEDLLKSDTVGLVTHEDFKAKREYLEKCAADEREKRMLKQRLEEAETRKLQLQKANASKLSFVNQSDSDYSDESEDVSTSRILSTPSPSPDNESKLIDGKSDANSSDGKANLNDERPCNVAPYSQNKRPRLTKDPNADTNYLPDRDRELALEAERERLRQEWFNEQERKKDELVSITYSYWDGAGHRRTLRCKKGTTVGRFLVMAAAQFQDLRNKSADDLMFIKEDLIIPHHYSFYDFIVSKARGRSGPLFNFDVVEDVRIFSDAKKEKEDAHAAKVVERRWYERNKHIFPASRWSTFDPKKKYDRYTIHGD